MPLPMDHMQVNKGLDGPQAPDGCQLALVYPETFAERPRTGAEFESALTW